MTRTIQAELVTRMGEMKMHTKSLPESLKTGNALTPPGVNETISE
jgi:hypothetical protein